MQLNLFDMHKGRRPVGAPVRLERIVKPPKRVTATYLIKEARRIGANAFETKAVQILMMVNGPENALEYLHILERKKAV